MFLKIIIRLIFLLVGAVITIHLFFDPFHDPVDMKQQRIQSDFNCIHNGIKAFVTSNSRLPNSFGDLDFNIVGKCLLDPFGKEYIFSINSGSYVISTLGADARVGGACDATDYNSGMVELKVDC